MIVIDAAVETGGVGDDVNLTHIVDNKMQDDAFVESCRGEAKFPGPFCDVVVEEFLGFVRQEHNNSVECALNRRAE